MSRWCLIAFAALLAPAARADEYVVTVFAAEAVPFEPKKTHTFVAAHRIPGGGGAVETHWISWFPECRRVRGLTLAPERGTNLSLEETFRHCRDQQMRVSVWGPYRADKELFERIKAQRAKLESGKVLYKPTDNFYPSDVACNCYHAIWQPVAPLRKCSGPFNCGDASGGTTVHLFRSWLCDPADTRDEFLDLSVPKGEPVTRRAFDARPTRADAVRSAIGR